MSLCGSMSSSDLTTTVQLPRYLASSTLEVCADAGGCLGSFGQSRADLSKREASQPRWERLLHRMRLGVE